MLAAKHRRSVDSAPSAELPSLAGARIDVLLRLASARDFVEVAEIVCTFARVATASCRVTMHASDGRPVLAIDCCALADSERLAYVRDDWCDDPLLQAIRVQESPVEDARPDHHALMLPVYASDGLLGSVLVTRPRPIDSALRRDFTMIAGRAAVRLARLGIDVPMSGPLARLTPRQCDVALMASSGRENTEIAIALGIAKDTVKKHLKDVFEELVVSNRTELARMIGNRAMPTDLPVGITRRGSVTITRP